MGQMRVHETGPWVIFLCPLYWVQFMRGVGHGVGLGLTAFSNQELFT